MFVASQDLGTLDLEDDLLASSFVFALRMFFFFVLADVEVHLIFTSVATTSC